MGSNCEKLIWWQGKRVNSGSVSIKQCTFAGAVMVNKVITKIQWQAVVPIAKGGAILSGG
jgi:hypothetical protein